jgi:hypothetical protein
MKNRSVRRGTSLFMAALAALALLGAAGSAQGAGDVQKEILDREARRIAAMVQADVKTLGEILRDDLTYIHSSGPLEGKAAILDEISTGKLRYESIEPSEVVVRPYGETAVATGRALLKVNALGRALAFSVRFTEVWVRTGGVWQLAAWQSTRIPES